MEGLCRKRPRQPGSSTEPRVSRMTSHQWRDYFRRNRLPAHLCYTYGCGVVAYSIFDHKSLNRLDRYRVVTATLMALFYFLLPVSSMSRRRVNTSEHSSRCTAVSQKQSENHKAATQNFRTHAPTENCDIMMVYVCVPAIKNASIDLSRQNLNVTTMGSTAQVPKIISPQTTSNIIRPRPRQCTTIERSPRNGSTQGTRGASNEVVHNVKQRETT